MTLEEKARLSCYQTVAVLNEAHQVFLVQHSADRRIFVKKTCEVYSLPVYRALQAHPVEGIPRIYELFEDEGRLTVIEEYVQGRSLQQILDAQGLIDEETAAGWTVQLAQTVSRLHQMVPPIIHRDNKPSNVLLAERG